MKKVLLWMLAVVAMVGGSAHAQDITGKWQGTLQAGKDLRIIMEFSKDDGKLKVVMYRIDEGGQPINASSMSQNGSSVKFAIQLLGGTYDGKLGADGKSISETWTQGPTSIAIDHVEKPSAS